MSPMRQDHLLKLVEQAFEVLRRIRKRRQDGDPADAIREADAATDDVLGPMAAIAARMEASTAAQLLRDPERVTLWASLLAEKAEALRGTPAAPATGRRALETAAEAWLLEDDQRRLSPTLRELLAGTLAMTREWARPGELSERHQAAVEDALRRLRTPPEGV